MREHTPDCAPLSPIVPKKLEEADTIQFRCHPDISCFNECCRRADITLTPYDVVRLKDRLGMSSTDFLAEYTVPFEMDSDGLPGVKLRTRDEEPVCLFMDDATGCTIYGDRPSACRYYPLGLMAMRPKGEPQDEAMFFLVKEDHCLGHREDRELTIADYRREQGLEHFDAVNRDWYRIMLKKGSAGPVVGQAITEISLQLFFMVSYDVDRFRRFVQSDNFQRVYDLDEETYRSVLRDDEALLRFGFKLLRQAFFAEDFIPLKEDKVREREEERRKVWEMRRKAEKEKIDQEAAGLGPAEYLGEDDD